MYLRECLMILFQIVGTFQKFLSQFKLKISIYNSGNYLPTCMIGGARNSTCNRCKMGLVKFKCEFGFKSSSQLILTTLFSAITEEVYHRKIAG